MHMSTSTLCTRVQHVLQIFVLMMLLIISIKCLFCFDIMIKMMKLMIIPFLTAVQIHSPFSIRDLSMHSIIEHSIIRIEIWVLTFWEVVVSILGQSLDNKAGGPESLEMCFFRESTVLTIQDAMSC